MLKNLHNWTRDEKLYAIKGLRLVTPERRAEFLLQLIVDDDPVVRGKAALAIQDCSDSVLLKAADALISNNKAETQILAMELLGATTNTDFSATIKSLLKSDDSRVIKSAIEIMDRLPTDSAIELLDSLMDEYTDEFDNALLRLFSRFHPPELFPIARKWFEHASNGTQSEILQITAVMSTENASEWTRTKLDQTKLNSNQKSLIKWLIDSRNSE